MVQKNRMSLIRKRLIAGIMTAAMLIPLVIGGTGVTVRAAQSVDVELCIRPGLSMSLDGTEGDTIDDMLTANPEDVFVWDEETQTTKPVTCKTLDDVVEASSMYVYDRKSDSMVKYTASSWLDSSGSLYDGSTPIMAADSGKQLRAHWDDLDWYSVNLTNDPSQSYVMSLRSGTDPKYLSLTDDNNGIMTGISVTPVQAGLGWYEGTVTTEPISGNSVMLSVDCSCERFELSYYDNAFTENTGSFYVDTVSASMTVADALITMGINAVDVEVALGGEFLGWGTVVEDENGLSVVDDSVPLLTTAQLMALPVDKSLHFCVVSTLDAAEPQFLYLMTGTGSLTWDEVWDDKTISRKENERSFGLLNVPSRVDDCMQVYDGVSNVEVAAADDAGRTFLGWKQARILTDGEGFTYVDTNVFGDAAVYEDKPLYSTADLMAMSCSDLRLISQMLGDPAYEEGPTAVFAAQYDGNTADYYQAVFFESPFFCKVTGTYDDYDETGSPVTNNFEEIWMPAGFGIRRDGETAAEAVCREHGRTISDMSDPIYDWDGTLIVDFEPFRGWRLLDDSYEFVDDKLYTTQEALAYRMTVDGPSELHFVDARAAEREDDGSFFDQPAPVLIHAGNGEFTLASKVDPSDTLTTDWTDVTEVNAGTRASVEITAVARDGFTFDGWDVISYESGGVFEGMPGQEGVYDGGVYDVTLSRDVYETGMPVFTYAALYDCTVLDEGVSTEVVNGYLNDPENYPKLYLRARWLYDNEGAVLKTKTEPLTTVPAELSSVYSSAEEIEADLHQALAELPDAYEPGDVVDGYVYTVDDEGEHILSEEEIASQEGPVYVKLPYPEGSTSQGRFIILHMIDSGEKAGEIETLYPEANPDGLVVQVNGTSPFLVGYMSVRDEDEDEKLILAAGDDRYETNVIIAAEAFPEGSDTVVIVTGKNFPDALTANGFAGSVGTGVPILMSKLQALPDCTKTLLTDIWNGSVKKAIVIGGGFTDTFKADLRRCGITTITEIKGKDRFATAEEVCKAGFASGQYTGDSTLVIATGMAAADALSMSSWCYLDGMPMLLVNSSGNLRQSAKDLIREYGFKNIIVAGAESRVASAGLAELGYSEENGNLVRLASNTRYTTSIEIAKYFLNKTGHTGTYDGLCFAPGSDKNFPDALSGGMLAAANGMPVVLINKNAESDPVISWCQSENLSESHNMYALGACSTEAILERVLACCSASGIPALT
ncbi:MAG: cell wall-binding repeat-containing protein [Lachnospiraceae bacterium]|nr:cell wall-binding repeat-containing protein [Lachnospiraceae bacterium]